MSEELNGLHIFSGTIGTLQEFANFITFYKIKEKNIIARFILYNKSSFKTK